MPYNLITLPKNQRTVSNKVGVAYHRHKLNKFQQLFGVVSYCLSDRSIKLIKVGIAHPTSYSF